MEEPSNAVLAAKIDFLVETVHRIEAQTNKTNGRVTALEMFRNKQMGVWSVITILIGAAMTKIITLILEMFSRPK